MYNRPPGKTRRDIPFYHDKTEAEFSRDKYENYEQTVRRQLLLHYGEKVTGVYPYAEIEQFILNRIPQEGERKILEIGCGVGKISGVIAAQNPTFQCVGIDFSYQPLRAAHDFLTQEKDLEINGERQGWKNAILPGENLQNLDFILAKAENLPFNDDTFDVLFSCFLLDRVENISATISETHRVLKPGGKLLTVLPQNFQNAEHWQYFFPIEKLLTEMKKNGFTLSATVKNIQITEPLDAAGNAVIWRCKAWQMTKKC